MVRLEVKLSKSLYCKPIARNYFIFSLLGYVFATEPSEVAEILLEVVQVYVYMWPPNLNWPNQFSICMKILFSYIIPDNFTGSISCLIQFLNIFHPTMKVQ